MFRSDSSMCFKSLEPDYGDNILNCNYFGLHIPDINSHIFLGLHYSWVLNKMLFFSLLFLRTRLRRNAIMKWVSSETDGFNDFKSNVQILVNNENDAIFKVNVYNHLMCSLTINIYIYTDTGFHGRIIYLMKAWAILIWNLIRRKIKPSILF